MIGPPTTTHSQHSATDFATHFVNKVEKIRAGTATATDLEVANRPSISLSSFRSVTTEEVHQLLRKSLCKQCTLDPAPTWLVKRAGHVLAPVITAICNSSLQSGVLPDSQKQAIVRARLKKPSLDPDDLNSFRPISNLSFLSKLLERIVAGQFITHVDQNQLLPSRQSAYRQFHSTESAILAVHNDIVRAVDQGDVVAVVLLDLSSAFDTVDHSTLLRIIQTAVKVFTHRSITHLVPVVPFKPHADFFYSIKSV